MEKDSIMTIINRKYINPRWVSDDRDQIECIIRVEHDHGGFEDARALISDPNNDNPDWAAIMDQFTKEKLDADIEASLVEHRKREEKHRAERKRGDDRRNQEGLFEVKLEIFQIEEIKNSKDRASKAAIRKAKTKSESIIRGSVLLMKEQAKKVE